MAYRMRRSFVGSDGTVSIVKIVCLSLLESKEVNKRFAPEPSESSVFQDSYVYERFHVPVYFA